MTDAVKSESARMWLRHETADLHTELDAMLSQTDFDDRGAYADFLARQAAPLFAIEAALEQAAVVETIADWRQRRRADAIRVDLALLDRPIPAPAATPRIEGIDAMFGALYVLEGSRLGAKFLVRNARGSKDTVVRAATTYLSHGEASRFWPAFLEALARHEAHGCDRTRLVEGARGTFAVFIDCAKRPQGAPRPD